MKHFLIVFVLGLAFLLCACGPQRHQFNLEKEGTAYNYDEKVYFYHPKGWQVQKDTIKFSLDIKNPKAREGFYLDTFDINSQNTTSELINLYTTQLTGLGIEITDVKKEKLDNAQSCVLISGKQPKDQTAFSEVVVFIDSKQYVYAYIAEQTVYEKHIQTMSRYLESLAVNESQKAV